MPSTMPISGRAVQCPYHDGRYAWRSMCGPGFTGVAPRVHGKTGVCPQYPRPHNKLLSVGPGEGEGEGKGDEERRDNLVIGLHSSAAWSCVACTPLTHTSSATCAPQLLTCMQGMAASSDCHSCPAAAHPLTPCSNSRAAAIDTAAWC